MQCTVLSYLLLTLAALCTVSFAHATPDAMVIVPSTIKATEHWHGLLRRELHRMVERRQSAGARNETAIEQLDLQAWAKETTQKCIEQLKNVTKASNPSGIAVCYNLPFLSTDSGVFAADLRLYQVSAPQGDWASIGGNIDVSLMYNGAAVQLRNESAEEAAATQQASASTDGPKKVQEFHFIGQIDRLLLQTDKTDEQLKTLLTPNITLIATNSTGQQLMTVLSTNEATFVNGVFSDLVASEAQNSTAAAAASATPFKLPGTRIEIVPIGLYFYSTYLGLALLIFGYGTFERQRFREQYRKRMAQQGAFGGSRAI